MGKQEHRAAVHGNAWSVAMPGEDVQMNLKLNKQMTIKAGQQFTIRSAGVTVGSGKVSY